MRTAVIRVAVISMGLAAVVTGSASLAGAATSPATSPAAGFAAVRNSPLALAVIKSDTFAGYEPAAGPATAKATFKVPAITCTSASTGISPGVQFDGIDGIDSGAAALIFCSNGQATYYAHLVIGATQTNPFTVQPGDTLTVTASDATTETSATVKDVTTGSTDTASGPGEGALSAYAGIFDVGANGAEWGVPTFMKVPFSLVRAGGHALGLTRPAEVERVNGTTVQLVPTAITGGNAFAVLFKHN